MTTNMSDLHLESANRLLTFETEHDILVYNVTNKYEAKQSVAKLTRKRKIEEWFKVKRWKSGMRSEEPKEFTMG